MFVRQNQQQFRNSNADVQIFYGSGSPSAASQKIWSKPVGVSHVYMMLIGGGGTGNSSTGGGSGAVTVWYGAAQNVPEALIVNPGGPGGNSTSNIYYKSSLATLVTLLTASPGSAGGSTAGSAMSPNQFTCSGFFQSVAGQAGTGGAGGTAPSGTTFLGGGALQGSGCTANYGYTDGGNWTTGGYFQLQPIIVGMGASSPSASTNITAIGCGGGSDGNIGSKGGPGIVLIASW